MNWKPSWNRSRNSAGIAPDQDEEETDEIDEDEAEIVEEKI